MRLGNDTFDRHARHSQLRGDNQSFSRRNPENWRLLYHYGFYKLFYRLHPLDKARQNKGSMLPSPSTSPTRTFWMREERKKQFPFHKLLENITNIPGIPLTTISGVFAYNCLTLSPRPGRSAP